MKTRREISELVSRAFAKWALVVVGVLNVVPVQGQHITPLIEFTNVWKYDRSGLELGTAWRTNDFDDSAWPQGPGLLGFEDVIAPYLIHVPSGIGTTIPVSGSVTTFYFRTTFQFTGATNFVQLFATNLVDDGCLLWLNGQLAGALRLAPNANASTLATGGPASEGQFDVLVLTNFLREGENQLAVEVHQSAAISADVMFGMRLLAFTPTPLVITNQPTDLIVTLGGPISFQVGVSGGPVSYRWQWNGRHIANATNRVLTINSAQFAYAGDYRVICSNVVGVVTSEVARLIVYLDSSGPEVITAIEDTGYGPGRINIRFSEVLLNTVPATSRYSPRNLTNYTLTRLATGQTVEITNAQYGGTQVLLSLNSADPDWVRFDDYFVTINNVADARTNSIAPGTTVPVQWQVRTNLFQDTYPWEFHSSAYFDSSVYDEPWYAIDYQPGSWWGQGLAPFYGIVAPTINCTSLSQAQTPVGWQPEPVLLRTTFNYPTNWPSTGALLLRFAVDDGLVLFLNGTEIYRYNVSGLPGSPVTRSLRSVQIIGSATCTTNISLVASNLNPGLNWLAAAVVQSSETFDSDVFFTLEMDATGLFAFTTPPEPPPLLQLTVQESNLVQFDWAGGGYTLESSTNLDAGPLSHPQGPWTQVPQLSRPYLWNLTNSPARFFRLKK